MTYKLFFLVIGMYYLLKKSKFYFQFLRIFGGKLKWKINTGMIGSKKFRFFFQLEPYIKFNTLYA